MRHHGQLEQGLPPSSLASNVSSIAVLQPQPARPAPVFSANAGKISTTMSATNSSEVVSNTPVTISNTPCAMSAPPTTTSSCVASSGFAQTSFGGGPLQTNGSLSRNKVSCYISYVVSPLYYALGSYYTLWYFLCNYCINVCRITKLNVMEAQP